MPPPDRLPAAAFKLMLAIVVVFALAALYGQWQHGRRPAVESARILGRAAISPTPSPNEP